MKKYINLLLIPIIIVTLKGFIKQEFDAEHFVFRHTKHGCGSIAIYKREPTLTDKITDLKIIEYTCDSVISVEKK